ncbi:MAG: carbohydrate ABC transporter permease [Spirochaetota bacterium]
MRVPPILLRKAGVYLLLIVGAVFCVVPLLWQVRSSLMPIEDIFKLPLILFPRSLELSNYVDAFTLVPLGRYYLNTVYVVTINVVGALLSNLSIAYAFARLAFPGKRIMFAASMGTLMLPQSVQLIPLFLEWNMIGGINTFYPLTIPAFFGNAFFIFLLVQFFRTIPRDYDEAALIDGAGYPQIIARVIVPMSTPAIATVAIFQFMLSWNDFMGPLVFLQDSELYTLSVGLRSFLSTFYTPWPALMAASTLTVLPLIVLFFLAQRYFISGLTTGGLKG